MRVEREPIVGVAVGYGHAVQVNVVVAVRTLREVVIIQWADDGQSQREQRGGEGKHASQRGWVLYSRTRLKTARDAPLGAWFGNHKSECWSARIVATLTRLSLTVR